MGASQARHILVRSWSPSHDPLQITGVTNHPKIHAFKKWGHTHEISHQTFFQACNDSLASANFWLPIFGLPPKIGTDPFLYKLVVCDLSKRAHNTYRCEHETSVLCWRSVCRLCSRDSRVASNIFIHAHERLVARHILAHSLACVLSPSLPPSFSPALYYSLPLFLLPSFTL